MKVVILGGGVIGITSAYYLAKAGAEVTVIEREAGAALQTSYANAAQLCTGCASPWAAPGIPLKALKWLFQRHAPLSIVPDGTVGQLHWVGQFLRNCTRERYDINRSRMLLLAQHSQDCLQDLLREFDITFDHRAKGTLQLFRTEDQWCRAEREIRSLRDAGVEVSLLSAEACVSVEPALSRVRQQVAGGLHYPCDETGDCYQFTEALAKHAAAMGVRFCFDTEVKALHVSKERVDEVELADGSVRADHVVVAMGSYSTSLLQSVGVHLPVYPVKGYSLTATLTDEAAAPVSTVLDDTYKVAVTRLGSRVRVGGIAQLAGFDQALDPRRQATLELVLRDLFPDAASGADAQFWTGLRPMTPDGTPLVGATRLANLWTNTGHGTLGWTMACGSGQLLADLICGRTHALPAAAYNLSRYSCDR
jgi:D-amino-acid dehydrogenase